MEGEGEAANLKTWKPGRRRISGGSMRADSSSDTNGEGPEIMVNSCVEAMEGRMILNRLRKFVPQMGGKSNE